MAKKALIVVDYQYDFVDPKGSLYVKDAETVKDYIWKKINHYKEAKDLVIATKDWHPPNHISFDHWPSHCVWETKGAELIFDESVFDKIILKGVRVISDSYSGFYDDDNSSNGLKEFLEKHDIKKLELVGVALNICVGATYKDAIRLGYQCKNWFWRMQTYDKTK